MSTFLRMTHWMHPDKPPMSLVVEQESLESEDVFDAVEHMKQAGFFVTYEVFDDSDPISATTKHAVPLPGSDAFHRERNMAIAYFYYVTAIQWVTKDGVLLGTIPAPLSREDLAWVLRCLATHDNYKGQTVTVPLQDGTTIEMKGGEVLPYGA